MGEEDGHTFNLALAEVQKQQEKSFVAWQSLV